MGNGHSADKTASKIIRLLNLMNGLDDGRRTTADRALQRLPDPQ
jgi:hypothetical protein